MCISSVQCVCVCRCFPVLNTLLLRNCKIILPYLWALQIQHPKNDLATKFRASSAPWMTRPYRWVLFSYQVEVSPIFSFIWWSFLLKAVWSYALFSKALVTSSNHSLHPGWAEKHKTHNIRQRTDRGDDVSIVIEWSSLVRLALLVFACFQKQIYFTSVFLCFAGKADVFPSVCEH